MRVLVMHVVNVLVLMQLLIAGALMAVGVWLHLTDQHRHQHTHEAREPVVGLRHLGTARTGAFSIAPFLWCRPGNSAAGRNGQPVLSLDHTAMASAFRFHDAQRRSPVNILEREIGAVGRAIHRDDMRIGADAAVADLRHLACVGLEHRDDSRLPSDV